MDLEICFICGVKLGRGNRSEVGSQEKMEKLVSVSNTVEHSSTIISDILSRILNETVMREESVCRICFNLLNDIDYHLKEAQEKTDEITAKFLDKEKDPLHYNPSSLVDPRNQDTNNPVTKKRRIFGKLVTTSGGRPDAATKGIKEDLGDPENLEYISIGTDPNIPVTGKLINYVRYNQRSEKNLETKNIQIVGIQNPRRSNPAQSPAPDSEVGASSADEMTVNELAEKKRRLISRVLAPSKRSRHEVRDDPDDIDFDADGAPIYEEELTIDTEKERYENVDDREMERVKRKKEKKRKKKEKERERKLRFLQQERDKREREEVRRQDIVLRLTDDESEVEETKENTSPKKTKDIQTVDLAQLGHLFSSKSPEKEIIVNQQIVAKKTVPTPGARKQMDFSEQTFYIVPQIYNSGEEPCIGEIIAQSEPITNNIIVKEHTSLNLQDISDESDAEYTTQTQYTQMKTSNTSMGSMVVVNSPQVYRQQGVSRVPTHQDLNQSVGSKTGAVASISCPHCDKKFMRGYNMRVHIDRVHNKSKPWQCQFCEKSFATTSDLKQHMSSHGMGKIHKCADCGRQFNNRDSAILHRKQHNNERTHVCVECGKGFFKSSCLTRHMRCHTGEKPFSCQFCDRKFSQITTLKHHKKVCKYITSEILGPDVKVIYEQKIEVNPHRKLNISL